MNTEKYIIDNVEFTVIINEKKDIIIKGMNYETKKKYVCQFSNGISIFTMIENNNDIVYKYILSCFKNKTFVLNKKTEPFYLQSTIVTEWKTEYPRFTFIINDMSELEVEYYNFKKTAADLEKQLESKANEVESMKKQLEDKLNEKELMKKKLEDLTNELESLESIKKHPLEDPNLIKFRVKEVGGDGIMKESYYHTVDKKLTINEFKQRFLKSGEKAEHIYIVFDGRTLNNDSKFEKFNLKSTSVIHIVHRPPYIKNEKPIEKVDEMAIEKPDEKKEKKKENNIAIDF